MATLYAQPSKEWVVPAKPKPGRKPKRDDPVVDEDASGDSKAKKVQNRAAQRAFRERKQSQLADLQARLAQYEQGEIERNVALQNVAKKLKEENERLKSDNEKLREEGDRVREENLAVRNRLQELQEEFLSYRRKMEPNSLHFDPGSTNASRKRPRTDSDSLASVSSPHASTSTSASAAPASKRKRGRDETRSSTPAVTTRTLNAAETRHVTKKGYSTLPPDYAPPPQLVHIYSPATSDGCSSRPSLVMSPDTSDNSAGAEPASLDEMPPDDDDYVVEKLDAPDFDTAVTSADELEVVDCGFCSRESGSCVCQEVSYGINQLLESTSQVGSIPGVLDTPVLEDTATIPSSSSILDNLPPVQPGVPLRSRRSKRLDADDGSVGNGLVRLAPMSQLLKPSSRPVCSGDPSNCLACADDPFGRAFCMALASGGVCRDPNCKRCLKLKPDPISQTPAPLEDSVKGKNKAISIDDMGTTSTVVGLGMGMNMETGMLLCCGDPKLCGGGLCGVRDPSSPIKSQRAPLQVASMGSNVHLASSSHLSTDTDDEREKGTVELPPLMSREGGDVPLEDSDEIPTNDAWARLKSHPNIAFADLSLLADVVARRTKCTGPRVPLSPTPERNTSHYDDERQDEHEAGDEQLHIDSVYPHLTLVPQEALVRSRRERFMRVQAEGVRDALAMLDVQRPT